METQLGELMQFHGSQHRSSLLSVVNFTSVSEPVYLQGFQHAGERKGERHCDGLLQKDWTGL